MYATLLIYVYYITFEKSLQLGFPSEIENQLPNGGHAVSFWIFPENLKDGSGKPVDPTNQAEDEVE